MSKIFVVRSVASKDPLQIQADGWELQGAALHLYNYNLEGVKSFTVAVFAPGAWATLEEVDLEKAIAAAKEQEEAAGTPQIIVPKKH